MATFNDLPDEASPALTDKVFTGRGSSSGAERKPTLQGIRDLMLANGVGDVDGPASVVDDSIAIFSGTTGKVIEASTWKTTGNALLSPTLPNPSGDAILQRWGGVLTSGGQAGGGLTDAIMGMTRDISGPSSTKLTDNWGLVYNKNNVAGSPRYGWSFETVYDVSMAGGSVESEVYLEHRIDNGSGGAAVGSVVGGRPLQWNISLPTSFATDPTAAATVNTATGRFPGYVGLIGVINSFSIQAYDSAGAARATWAWATSAASAGITIASSTGYTYQRFSDWGSRANNDENAIVGDATATLNIRNTATGFGASNGSQFVIGSSQHLEVTNFENSYIKFRTFGASFNPVMELSPGQRVFIGYNGSGISDTGVPLQVKGGGLFTTTGDTLLSVTGGSYPGIKITGTGLPSGVDIAAESTTDFRIRVNDNKPINLMTAGTSRMTFSSTNTSVAPLLVSTKLGVGVAAGTDQTVYVETTSFPASPTGAVFTPHQFRLNGALTTNNSQWACYGYLTNTGSAAVGTGAHGGGVLGRAGDTSSGAIPLYGIEARVDAAGTATTYGGIFSYANFIGASYSGELNGLFIRSELTSNGSTPIGTGLNAAIRVAALVGGSLKYSLLASDPIFTTAAIISRDSGNTADTRIAHDGDSGLITVSGGASGHLKLQPAAGAYCFLAQGLGLAPLSEGLTLGVNGFRWAGNFTSLSTIALDSSVTPANNGELMFQATSNTSLTFKYKGTDGTVRSASVVLI